MAGTEKQTLLVIADISGYTHFMLNNAKTLSHAQAVITGLMNSVIKEAKLPLKIAKLEGDAVFLYASDRGDGNWPKDLETLRLRLGRLYTAFTRKAEELHLGNTCACDACTHVDHLTLKLVVHYGQALFYRMGRFEELAGPDVIILHRLLKNSVGAKEYFLFTEVAFVALGLPDDTETYALGSETYEDVGTIPVRVQRNLDAIRFKPDPAFHTAHSNRRAKLKGMFEKMWAMMVSAKGRKFVHLDTE